MIRRAVLACGAVLASLAAIAAIVVALLVCRPVLVRPWVEKALAPRGGRATLSDLEATLRPPSVTVSGLAISGPPAEGDLLRISRLRFELVPERCFRGGPWLRGVEIRGLVIQRTRPRESKGPIDLTPLTRLFDIEDLSVTDARLLMALPQGIFTADGLRLRLVPGEDGIRRFEGAADVAFCRNGATVAQGKLSALGKITPGPSMEVGLESTAVRLDLPYLSGDVSIRTGLRLTRKAFRAQDLSLTMPSGRVRLGKRTPDIVGPVRLDAAAGATLAGKDPRLEVRGLAIADLLLARGTLSGPALEKLSGTFDGEIPRVERVRTILGPLLPAEMEGMELSGALPFRFGMSSLGKERVLTLELLPRDLTCSWPAAGLACRFGGSFRAVGPLQGWLHGKAGLSGRLQGTGRFERPPVAVRVFRFDLPLAGELAAPTLAGWKLSAGAGEATYDGRPLPLGGLELRGSARPVDRSYRLEDVAIRSGSLGAWKGELAFQGGNIAGLLGGSDLPTDNLVSLARTLSGEGWNGWSSSGAIDVTVRLEPAQGGSRIAAAATLKRIGFSSPSGDAMGQNLSGRLGLDALLVPLLRVNAGLSLSGGDALWGTVYVDFAKDPLDLRVRGTRAAPGEYKDLALEAGLEGFGRASAEGSARRTGGGWRHQGRIALEEARLGSIFRTFLRDPLATSRPDLAGMEMEGTAGIDLSFAGIGKTTDLQGTLRLRSGEVRRGSEPPLLAGLDVDLPVSYSLGAANPGRPRPSDPAEWGRLRLAKVRLGGQEMGPLDLPAVLVPNRFYLGGTANASLYGAKVSLGQLQVDEPLSPEFRIRMAAGLDGLDFARIGGKSLKLEGRLGGRLESVTIGRERMTAAGELTGDLFGGRLEIRRMAVDRPFSPGREIGADVTADRIDLERLSAALGVGRITGRLSGSMEGLRVAYGQPVAFHLRMASVPEKGVRQEVSLKAVNSISLVSTGSALSGLGVSLMTKFFREFPYEKIGFECGLKNDVFTVRGLIHEDGVEYLVKRRLFSGINVINANPDNRIGFSDMLDRARRVSGERPN